MIRPEYDPDLFYHWTKIKVRFRDLDPLRHVNNSVFSTYLEEARIDFINHIPEFHDSMKSGSSFVLVHLEVDFIKPVLFGENVLVGSSVREYGNSSIKGVQAIYSEEAKELKAVANTTGVWFDMKKNRPVSLPELPDWGKYLIKLPANG
jgi:acyl-CoA thioester hydrolase